MGINQIAMRDYDKIFSVPEDEQKGIMFAKQLIKQFKFILVGGVPFTGKSTFLQYVKKIHTFDISTFDRDKIMRDLFPSGKRDNKFYNYIEQFEKKAIPNLLSKEHRKVVVENIASKNSTRRKFLSYCEETPAKKPVIFMFDGPENRIVKRAVENNSRSFYFNDEQMKTYIQERKDAMHWPEHKEGWYHIFYFNTFGKPGETYLKKHTL